MFCMLVWYVVVVARDSLLSNFHNSSSIYTFHPFNALYVCSYSLPYHTVRFFFNILISDSSRIIITSNLIQYHVVNGKKHDDDNERCIIMFGYKRIHLVSCLNANASANRDFNNIISLSFFFCGFKFFVDDTL